MASAQTLEVTGKFQFLEDFRSNFALGGMTCHCDSFTLGQNPQCLMMSPGEDACQNTYHIPL